MFRATVLGVGQRGKSFVKGHGLLGIFVRGSPVRGHARRPRTVVGGRRDGLHVQNQQWNEDTEKRRSWRNTEWCVNFNIVFVLVYCPVEVGEQMDRS